MTYACKPGACRWLRPVTWYQLWSSRDMFNDLAWVGWLYSDPKGANMVISDRGARVHIYGAAKQPVPGENYAGVTGYTFNKPYIDESHEGPRQWFRLVTWPFKMGGVTPPKYAVGWLWTTPYRVKKYLVGSARGDYVVYYAGGQQISPHDVIH